MYVLFHLESLRMLYIDDDNDELCENTWISKHTFTSPERRKYRDSFGVTATMDFC